MIRYRWNWAKKWEVDAAEEVVGLVVLVPVVVEVERLVEVGRIYRHRHHRSRALYPVLKWMVTVNQKNSIALRRRSTEQPPEPSSIAVRSQLNN